MRKFFLLLLLALPVMAAAGEFRVGIVASQGNSSHAKLVGDEVENFVAGDDSAVAQIFSYQPSVDTAALDSLIAQAESSSDILVYIGEIPAGRASAKGTRKPSIAVFSSDAECAGGFRYVISPDIDYKAELSTFRELFRYQSLSVVYSGLSTCSSSICNSSKQKIISALDVPYVLVDVADLREGSLPQGLSAGGAALVLDQPQMTDEQYGELMGRLAKAGVRTFTMDGQKDAELGALAVNSKEKNFLKIARTTAVAVADIISGKQSDRDIKITRTTGLVLNLETARLAGFSPSWSYLRTAELLNYDKFYQHDKYIAYKDALESAVDTNEDVATGRIDMNTAQLLVDMSRSAFRPTLEFSTGISQIDEDRARMSQGTSPERTWKATFQLQQIIYSEDVFSLVDQAKSQEKAKASIAHQAELDVMHAAARAYLQVLRAKTYQKITQDNLETTKYNYDLAKNRDLAGAANPAELYRWEATIAQAKVDMVNASNNVKSAMTELARIIGEDIDGYYDLESVELDKSYGLLVGVDGEGMLSNPKAFTAFKKLMTERSVKNSTELNTLRYLTEAADRSVLSAERKYYMPTVAAGAEYSRKLSKQGEYSTPPYFYDDTDWSVGVTASIPIYQGGRRGAELSIEKATLRKLYHEKARATKLVKQRMIVSLENAKAAYNAYKLAGISAEAAKKTLQIVSDLYSRGAVSITELIDAQNAKLKADMNVASNKYSFMEKIADVERAYGSFFSSGEPEEERVIMNMITDSGRTGENK